MYTGLTYNEVYTKHPTYADWVLKTAETGDSPSEPLKRFARYLASREARSPEDVPAGKMDEEL